MSAGARIVIAGGGAAGTAAARTLAAHADAAAILHLTGPAEEAIDRTLVDKAILTGRIGADRARLRPVDGIEQREDSLASVDLTGERIGIRTSAGEVLAADALILATGSRARPAPALPGIRTHTLHSAADAVAIRAAVEQLTAEAGSPPRIVISGAGLVGMEAASHFAQTGAEVVIASRSPRPGDAVFGEEIAAQIRTALDGAATTMWGAELADVDLRADDVVIAAHGAEPLLVDGADAFVACTAADSAADRPAAGGIPVDGALRAVGSEHPVYAAGGIAAFPLAGTHIRVDHWDDAEVQGAHAARALAAELGLSGEPASAAYRPVSPWAARICGRALVGFGTAVPGGTALTVSADPLIAELRAPDGTVTGLVGLDAGRAIRDAAARTLLTDQRAGRP